MTRALSNDLRERVVAAVVSGESCRSVAARFGVAVSSVVKWSQRYRMTGSVAPGKMGGHRRRILVPHRAFIVERINETSNLTLHRLKDELAARQLLEQARGMLSSGRKAEAAQAQGLLQVTAKKYPETEAGREAAKLAGK